MLSSPLHLAMYPASLASLLLVYKSISQKQRGTKMPRWHRVQVATRVLALWKTWHASRTAYRPGEAITLYTRIFFFFTIENIFFFFTFPHSSCWRLGGWRKHVFQFKSTIFSRVMNYTLIHWSFKFFFSNFSHVYATRMVIKENICTLFPTARVPFCSLPTAFLLFLSLSLSLVLPLVLSFFYFHPLDQPRSTTDPTSHGLTPCLLILHFLLYFVHNRARIYTRVSTIRFIS